MRKRKLATLLILLVLVVAPGCRAIATAGVIVGAVALDIAVERACETEHRERPRHHHHHEPADCWCGS